MYVNRCTSTIYLQNQHLYVSHCDIKLIWFILLLLTVSSSSDAVTLTGSSEYAVPGDEFTLTCDVPEEATVVQFYRRSDATSPVGGIQVGGDQCYNVMVIPGRPLHTGCLFLCNVWSKPWYSVPVDHTATDGRPWICVVLYTYQP
ncbi:uncharacterized protein LOC117341002 [Pecten maximus]|uniref:uncharacterized protein LOC117341002 n=1 Tax=Pecten maximus TaxID=6579 RepID=UPI001458802D|nr:uncharacterized protein LOC117341002 [Pecten maximus]